MSLSIRILPFAFRLAVFVAFVSGACWYRCIICKIKKISTSYRYKHASSGRVVHSLLPLFLCVRTRFWRTLLSFPAVRALLHTFIQIDAFGFARFANMRLFSHLCFQRQAFLLRKQSNFSTFRFNFWNFTRSKHTENNFCMNKQT